MASVVGEGTLAELDGWFKRRYGKFVNVVPINNVLQDVIKFSEADSDGENFNEPIGLQLEHGVTYAPTNAGAFGLDPPIPAKKKNAQITGVQHVLRSALDYETIAKAAKSERAFGKATQRTFLDMRDSISKRLEIDLWYGQDELGTVTAGGAGTTVSIALAEWAPGIFSGMEGAKIEIFSNAGTTQRVGATSSYTIASIDYDANPPVITTTETLPTLTAGGTPDRIFFKTQRTASAHNTMAGMHTILTNTGTLFGISATTFALWRATSFAAGGAALTFGKIQRAIGNMVGKGLEESLLCLVSPRAWADLLVEQAAFRQYPTEKVKWENGVEGLRFYSQNGTVEIRSSFYCKQGYAYLVSPKEWKRLGATDLTFDLPDVDDGRKFFRPLSDNAGVEWRCYSHQALYTSKPGRAAIITGIVNS